MGDKLEKVPDNLGLSNLADKYRDIEKNFGEIIWNQISYFFPDEFDKSLLRLDDVIANIITNSDEGDGGTHVARIKDEEYDGVITDLYESIKGLHGMELDGFYIEVQGYNFRNDRDDFHKDNTAYHQINFRIKRKTKIINGDFFGKDEGVKGAITMLLKS